MIFKDEKEIRDFYENGKVYRNEESRWLFQPGNYREFGRRLLLDCANEGQSIDTMIWTLEQLGWGDMPLIAITEDIEWLDKKLGEKE